MENSINHDQIFEDMKKCFRESGLPVICDRLPCGRETYAFRSLIQDLPDADVHAWYDPEVGYVSVTIELSEKVEIEDKSALRMEINRLNCSYGLFHYVVCPDCGSLEMRSGIYINDRIPEEKLKFLLMRISNELRDSVPKIKRKIGEQK